MTDIAAPARLHGHAPTTRPRLDAKLGIGSLLLFGGLPAAILLSGCLYYLFRHVF